MRGDPLVGIVQPSVRAVVRIRQASGGLLASVLTLAGEVLSILAGVLELVVAE